MEVKRILSKGNIYKQAVHGSHDVKAKRRIQNRSVIKKFMKTAYFIARKKWAVRENFEDVIDLICELGDEDINIHLREASTRATYTSVRSVDSFIKALSDHLETVFLTRLTNAVDFSLLADETTNMADRAELSIFTRYINNGNKVKEEFLAW